MSFYYMKGNKMEQIIHAELKYFEICLFYGFFLRMTYDFFCIMRRLIIHRVYIVTIEDVVYGIFIGIKIFLLNYENNNGVVRFFMFLGLIIGSVIYHKIFSATVVLVFSTTIEYFLREISKILTIFGKNRKNVIKKWKRSKKIRKN